MSMNKTTSRSAVTEEQRVQALKFRMAGLSYQQIADHLGIARSAAYKLVKTALDRLHEEVHEGAEDLRELELQRMDQLFSLAYNNAMKGDIAAIDRCVKIMERRARLMGLDAATRSEISGSLLMSPQWLELKAVLVKTLASYPDAQRAVLTAITSGEEVNA